MSLSKKLGTLFTSLPAKERPETGGIDLDSCLFVDDGSQPPSISFPVRYPGTKSPLEVQESSVPPFSENLDDEEPFDSDLSKKLFSSFFVFSHL